MRDRRARRAYDWPGNLRELRHEMQRALVMAGGREQIDREDLSPRITGAGGIASAVDPGTLEDKLAAVERTELRAALDATGGNKTQAAVRLGLSRQGLLNKLARHGID